MLLLFPGTFLLCKVNNKHMHRGHFDDPDGAQRSCRSEGWTCEDCSQYITGSCFLWGVSPRPSPPVTVQSCPGVPVQLTYHIGMYVGVLVERTDVYAVVVSNPFKTLWCSWSAVCHPQGVSKRHSGENQRLTECIGEPLVLTRVIAARRPLWDG